MLSSVIEGVIILTSWVKYFFNVTIFSIQRYGWIITFAIALGYLTYTKVIVPQVDLRNRQRSYKEATNPKRVEILSHDMKSIRKRQQEIHIQKAKAAKDAQQKKKLEDMERKRIATPMEMKRRGQKLGHGAITT